MQKLNLQRLDKTFIIAEIGNNHEGNIKNAKKLIDLASRAGVDAVKFQTYITEKFISKVDKKRFDQLKKFEISHEQFIELKNFAHSKNLKFISTPLDLESAKFLSKNSDLIKIASSDNNFFPLIDKVISSKKNIIISTGLVSIDEILILRDRIYRALGKDLAHKNVAFLHCVTSYPVKDKFANIDSVNYLQQKLNFTIGYSDHTLGLDSVFVAVSMGAKIIEKHFTIDKNFSKFRDHSLSADFKEMSEMVKKIRKIELLKGKYQKKIQVCEKNYLNVVRRAPYSRRQIKKGELLTLNNTNFLRSSNSKKFLGLQNIIGKKSITNLKKNKKIFKKNIN
tara:strand:+ start:2157 stop:3167 length:1011 start_codon:yes stop_codon:yes gene_type:complete